jgi:hypothetical protein
MPRSSVHLRGDQLPSKNRRGFSTVIWCVPRLPWCYLFNDFNDLVKFVPSQFLLENPWFSRKTILKTILTLRIYSSAEIHWFEPGLSLGVPCSHQHLEQGLMIPLDFLHVRTRRVLTG